MDMRLRQFLTPSCRISGVQSNLSIGHSASRGSVDVRILDMSIKKARDPNLVPPQKWQLDWASEGKLSDFFDI